MNDTATSRLESILRAGGLAPKSVDVFGGHCIVTMHSQDAARKVFRLFQAAGFSRLKVGESIDEAKQNKGTCLNPTVHRVWRVWARIY